MTMPARIRLMTRLPLALLLTSHTSTTVRMPKPKAISMVICAPNPAMMAREAPKAEPLVAPRMSGEAMGFWKMPW